jgi:hypothetical protein
MQQVMRPYATAGIALVGASIIAVTPIAAPLPEIQTRPVQLVDAWSDLITDTTANLQLIADNYDPTAVSSLFSELGTNPSGVIDALFNLTPTVASDLTTLPGTISVQLPPGLELLIGQIGAEGATFNAISEVFGQLSTDPSSLLEAPATILNAFLNGHDEISLLNGIIDFTGFNGILAPLTDASINLNLPDLLNALGVGDISLSSLGVNLTDLLDQLQLGNLDLGGLFTALGIGDDGLGTLLGNPDLGTLLGDLGLGNLGLGSLSLTNLLGLDGNVDLSNLGLNTVLHAFGLDPTIATGLTPLVDAFLGSSDFTDEGLGSVIALLPTSFLDGILDPLNSTLGTLLDPLTTLPVLGPLLTSALSAAHIDLGSLLDASSLEGALNHVTIGDLLGAGPSIDASVSTLLGDLGLSVPTDLNIGGILEGLGFPDPIGGLTLDDLLGGLNLDSLSLTDLLNNVDLSTLLGDLGLSDLPLNLTNLGDLGDLTIGGLLGDLGVGDLAMINIDGFGGLGTLLADVIPQQILTSLGM